MLPVTLCMAALVVLLVAERANWRWIRAMAKMVASSAFVWASLTWGAEATLFGQLLLLGLILSWLGDALLLPSGSTYWFLSGLVAFLLAHLVYAFAFTQIALDPVALAVSAGLVGVVAWGVLRWLRPHLSSSFRWPVVAYVAAICLMLMMGLAVVGSGGPAVIGMGALGFALSDVSVARNRFVSEGFINSAWGLPAYFISQLVLAYSITQVP